MGSPCDEQKFLKGKTKHKVQLVRVARLEENRKTVTNSEIRTMEWKYRRDQLTSMNNFLEDFNFLNNHFLYVYAERITNFD
jgi:hypothetical protein